MTTSKASLFTDLRYVEKCASAKLFSSKAQHRKVPRNETNMASCLFVRLFAQPKRLVRDVEFLNHLPGDLVLTALWGRRLGATALMRLKWLQRDEMNGFSFYPFRLLAVVKANKCWLEILVFLRASRKKTSSFWQTTFYKDSRTPALSGANAK